MERQTDMRGKEKVLRKEESGRGADKEREEKSMEKYR